MGHLVWGESWSWEAYERLRERRTAGSKDSGAFADTAVLRPPRWQPTARDEPSPAPAGEDTDPPAEGERAADAATVAAASIAGAEDECPVAAQWRVLGAPWR